MAWRRPALRPVIPFTVRWLLAAVGGARGRLVDLAGRYAGAEPARRRPGNRGSAPRALGPPSDGRV